MNFEYIFYGYRSLVSGLPVALGLLYLIYRAISSGWETPFGFPAVSLLIAAGSVYVVVLLTIGVCYEQSQGNIME
jgi:putative ABC transport system permease protein